MVIDPNAVHSLLLRLCPALLSALCVGLAPSLMRGGAKRADPSVSAAVFATAYALACAAILYIDGAFATILSLPTQTHLSLGLCALLTAFVWLCLFTALTGGLSSKVVPVFAVWYLIVSLASRFLFGASFGVWHACCVVLALLGVVLVESRTRDLGRQLWFVYAVLATLAMAGLQLFRRASLGVSFDERIFAFLRASIAAVLLWAFVFARGKQRTMGVTTARAYLCLVIGALCLAGALYFGRLAPVESDGAFAAVSTIALPVSMLSSRILQKEKQPGSAVFGALLLLLGLAAMRFLG